MITNSNIYIVNENLLTQGLLPVAKRLPVITSFITDLMAPIQRLNNKDYSYIFGYTGSYYATSSTYNYLDIIIGGISNPFGQVYQSIISSNFNIPLSNTASWIEYTTNFIGVNERAYYFDQKLTLEWALNRFYNTTFRQPQGVTGYGPLSDIYIEDNSILVGEFVMAPYGSPYSTFMMPRSSSAYMSYTSLTFSGYTTGGTSWFTVWCPTASYNNIPGGSASIKSYVNTYNYQSVPFNVRSY